MEASDNRRPGDLILDRILPEADQETRERAREALRRYGLALLRLGERIDQAERLTDSRNRSRRPIIQPPPL